MQFCLRTQDEIEIFEVFFSKENTLIYSITTDLILEMSPQKPWHCLKIVRIRSFSGPYFPAFGLNTERHGVYLRIQSECGKILNTDAFHAVWREKNFSFSIGGNVSEICGNTVQL